jgi:nucleolar protein 14
MMMNEEELLTHKGRAIQNFEDQDHVILSDNDEDEGNLDAVDTEMHFGGGMFARAREQSAYGPSSGTDASMTQVYSQRKTELDDLIARRKILKAERMKSKEEQETTFDHLDESFSEIASLLKFRDKNKERKEREDLKASGNLDKADQEMADWDKEMKTYLFERKVKATDRTKTPEEVAKQEAERLHKLETRRLARMSGDFDEDDLTDISDDESNKYKNKKKKKELKVRKSKERNPDELDDDSHEAGNDEMEVKFTADGLVYMDEDGKVVKKVGENDGDDSDSSSSEGSSSSESEEEDDQILAVGTQVKGNYRVKEQFEEQAAWYDGVVTAVNKQRDGIFTYDVTYDDGDFEEGMEPENVRAIEKTAEEQEQEESLQSNELSTKRKRQKAKDKAR